MCFKKEFFGNHGKYPRKTLKCESGLSTFDDLNIVNLPETSSITWREFSKTFAGAFLSKQILSEMYSEPVQISKMEHLAKLLNDY